MFEFSLCWGRLGRCTGITGAVPAIRQDHMMRNGKSLNTELSNPPGFWFLELEHRVKAITQGSGRKGVRFAMQSLWRRVRMSDLRYDASSCRCGA